MTITLGRNDPCHCGSGKKYKRCHWNEDQRAVAERAAAEQARRKRLDAVGHPTDSEMRGLYEEVTGRNAPAGPLPAEIRQTVTELWQQRRLAEQSRAQLGERQAEWESHFAAQPGEFERIAAELASDPFFDGYELTDENIAKVRQQLGEMPEAEADLHGYATEAIRISLDQEDRTNFHEAMLSLLPDLVDEGKFKEAYVLTTCADRVLVPDAPLSPFLRDVVVRSLKKE